MVPRELISERIQKYEDALWGGVGAIQARGGNITYREWQIFAQTLNIDLKYPGINGIGVIHSVTPEKLERYLEEQRALRPDYAIHPAHSESEYLPITYIEPVETNAKAVGLDMAHEANRFAAAKQARDSGTAQFTGPITLVQDSQKTPGFLFYAPYYQGGTYASVEERRRHFAGMVYAPFVVNKLLEGTLSKDKRHVGLRLRDGTDTLYDELLASEQDFDPAPLFTRSVDLVLYGRTWRFDIHSGLSFRAEATSNQPTSILIGGLVIDCMLLGLFVMLTKANRDAVDYADRLTSELRAEKVQLERSNADLEQFAYVASHDLQEPLRMVGNFTQLLQKRYAGQLDDKADSYIKFAVDGVTRMQKLLNELLNFSRLGSQDNPLEAASTANAFSNARDTLQQAIEATGALVDIGVLPQVRGDESQLTQLFQNLVGNAIKFQSDGQRPHIRISATEQAEDWLFTVKDNGIGIEPQYTDQIFDMFKRLHGRNSYSGTGIGLAICRKIVVRHGGEIWVDSVPGGGSTFSFTLAKTDPQVRFTPAPQSAVEERAPPPAEAERRAS